MALGDVAFGSKPAAQPSAPRVRSTLNSRRPGGHTGRQLRAGSRRDPGRSFRSLPNHIDILAARRTNGERELISPDRNEALLNCTVPIRKGCIQHELRLLRSASFTEYVPK